MTHTTLRLLHVSFILGGFVTALQFSDTHPSTIVFFTWWLVYTIAPTIIKGVLQGIDEVTESSASMDITGF